MTQMLQTSGSTTARRLGDCEEVAELLGLKVSWVRDRCRPSTPQEQKIPGMIRLGRYVKFQMWVVEDWIAKGCPFSNPEPMRVESFPIRKASMR